MNSKSKPIQKKRLQEEKDMFVVMFEDLEDECCAPAIIGESMARKPIITTTMELAKQAKEERINLTLDMFYENFLVAKKDELEWTEGIKKIERIYSSRFEIKVPTLERLLHCAHFDTEEEARGFLKLLTQVMNGERPKDLKWVRQVCQSYLRVSMYITKGTVMVERKETNTEKEEKPEKFTVMPRHDETWKGQKKWVYVESKDPLLKERNRLIKFLVNIKNGSNGNHEFHCSMRKEDGSYTKLEQELKELKYEFDVVETWPPVYAFENISV